MYNCRRNWPRQSSAILSRFFEIGGGEESRTKSVVGERQKLGGPQYLAKWAWLEARGKRRGKETALNWVYTTAAAVPFSFYHQIKKKKPYMLLTTTSSHLRSHSSPPLNKILSFWAISYQQHLFQGNKQHNFVLAAHKSRRSLSPLPHAKENNINQTQIFNLRERHNVSWMRREKREKKDCYLSAQ